MNDASRHEVERTAAEALAATVRASLAGIRASLGYHFFATWSTASRGTAT
jgi:hypothetical protein